MIPLVDLHRHLEGSIRSGTCIELATRAGSVMLPAQWRAALVAAEREEGLLPYLAKIENATVLVRTLDDWRRCRSVSGVEDIMLGRGLIARPDLALQIRAAQCGESITPMGWREVLPYFQDFWLQVCNKLPPKYAQGRFKQWLKALGRSYDEAATLFVATRSETDVARLDFALREHAATF